MSSGACRARLGRVQGQDVEDRGDGEDDVKVRNVEDFAAPGLEPALPRFPAAARTVSIAT
jgi:hypothetical protein